jgi:hypothetical protein
MMKSTVPVMMAPAAKTGPSFLRGLGDLAKVTAVSIALNGALLGVLLWHFG